MPLSTNNFRCCCYYVLLCTIYCWVISCFAGTIGMYEAQNKKFNSDLHDDAIKWKHFPCYLPFVPGIHRSPVNSPHKGQRRGALMSSLIWAWINGWVNYCEAGDLRRHIAHYDVTVMIILTYGYITTKWMWLSIHVLISVSLPSNLWYQTQQIPQLEWFSSLIAVVFAQSNETWCYVDNEDIIELNQRIQAMLQPHLSDQQVRCLLRCDLD